MKNEKLISELRDDFHFVKPAIDDICQAFERTTSIGYDPLQITDLPKLIENPSVFLENRKREYLKKNPLKIAGLVVDIEKAAALISIDQGVIFEIKKAAQKVRHLPNLPVVLRMGKLHPDEGFVFCDEKLQEFTEANTVNPKTAEQRQLHELLRDFEDILNRLAGAGINPYAIRHPLNWLIRSNGEFYELNFEAVREILQC